MYLLLKFDMLRMQSLRLPASVCSAPGTAIVDVIATPGVCALQKQNCRLCACAFRPLPSQHSS